MARRLSRARPAPRAPGTVVVGAARSAPAPRCAEYSSQLQWGGARATAPAVEKSGACPSPAGHWGWQQAALPRPTSPPRARVHTGAERCRPRKAQRRDGTGALAAPSEGGREALVCVFLGGDWTEKVAPLRLRGRVPPDARHNSPAATPSLAAWPVGRPTRRRPCAWTGVTPRSAAERSIAARPQARPPAPPPFRLSPDLARHGCAGRAQRKGLVGGVERPRRPQKNIRAPSCPLVCPTGPPRHPKRGAAGRPAHAPGRPQLTTPGATGRMRGRAHGPDGLPRLAAGLGVRREAPDLGAKRGRAAQRASQ